MMFLQKTVGSFTSIFHPLLAHREFTYAMLPFEPSLLLKTLSLFSFNLLPPTKAVLIASVSPNTNPYSHLFGPGPFWLV